MAAWPLGARAQTGGTASQLSSTPLVGFLNSASATTYRFNANSFREGLKQAGFIEGQNVRIEERWANGDYQALPMLAAELVAKGVVAIAATGDVASARAARDASTTVPVVFTVGGDPVHFGLVASFNRPGGHVTGIMFASNALGAKQIQLLHEMVPNIRRVALLMNPDNPNALTEQLTRRPAQRNLTKWLSSSMRATQPKSTLLSRSFFAQSAMPLLPRATQ